MTKSCTRLYSLDLSRWIAAFLVICIHTVPLSSFSRLGNALFVQVVCRLAVPFFFVCSGYLLRKKTAKAEPGQIAWNLLGHSVRSLGTIYLFWSAVWIICNTASGISCFYPAAQWNLYFYPGIYQLLWFMLALLLGEVCMIFFAGRKFQYYLIFCCLVFLLQQLVRLGVYFPKDAFFESSLWNGIYYVAVGGLCFELKDRVVMTSKRLFAVVVICSGGVVCCYGLQRYVQITILPVFFLLPEIFCVFLWLLKLRLPESLEKRIPSQWLRDVSVLLYVLHGLVIFYMDRFMPNLNSAYRFGFVFVATLLLAECVRRLSQWLPIRKLCF